MNTENRLSWEQVDIERKAGFKGGKYTGVNYNLTFFIAILFTVVIYGSLYPLYSGEGKSKAIADMFYERGYIPYAIAFFSSWSIAILIVKSFKIRLQKKTLEMQVVPMDHKFSLTPQTANVVIDNIYRVVDSPRHFVLFNRIDLALSNLKNIGRIGDVDEILRSHAENDENHMESSYTILKGFIWAIPVLGFIGTVIGLSEAIGGFGGVLEKSDEIDQIKDGLQSVTGGLSTAFETTLLALVFALLIQLITTMVKKKEEDFLDEAGEYCMRCVVAKLRLTEEPEELLKEEDLNDVASP
ncbi:MAG: MotA/TolQ/ExbB proton channel family protein [Lentisphaeraceae bacterium]|nr:MotA/TolQ/ExbB proton channel family protein [Lentisphaeraceae bacterium]